MIGIIIPTKNNITELFKCLNSIKETTAEEYKVYVADTGSSKRIKRETITEINRLFPTNSTFIEYDYYNFAKINNDVVANHIADDVDVLIFCNNDIQIVTTGLLDRIYTGIIKNQDIVGTCGCRLVYPINNIIQHDGQFIQRVIEHNNMVVMGHVHQGTPSANITRNSPIKVDGNTFALVGTLRSTFEKIGMLSTEYIECFEDVQYNLECSNLGLTNVLLESKYWAYHHESLSRGRSQESFDRLHADHAIIRKYVNEVFTGLLSPYRRRGER